MGVTLARLRSQGLRKGVVGGSLPWLVVAGVLWGIRALRWAWRREEEIIAEQVLRPGERFEVVSQPGSGRGRRRRRRG